MNPWDVNKLMLKILGPIHKSDLSITEKKEMSEDLAKLYKAYFNILSKYQAKDTLLELYDEKARHFIYKLNDKLIQLGYLKPPESLTYKQVVEIDGIKYQFTRDFERLFFYNENIYFQNWEELKPVRWYGKAWHLYTLCKVLGSTFQEDFSSFIPFFVRKNGKPYSIEYLQNTNSAYSEYIDDLFNELKPLANGWIAKM